MNIPFRKKWISILLLIFFVLLPAAAQENEQIPRQLFIPRPETMAAEGSIMDESVIERREQVLQRYILVAAAEQTDVVVTEREEDADCRLTVQIDYREDTLILRFSLYDIYFGKELAEWETSLSRFSLKELTVKMGEEGIARIQNLLPPRDPEVVEVVTEKVVEEVEVQKVYVEAEGVEVTLSGMAGTRILSGTGDEYRIGETGILKLDLPVDSFFDFTAFLEGYYPEKQEVVVGSEPMSVAVDMVKASRWGFDISFVMIDFALSPAVQFFYKPNYGYVNFRITQNFLSLYTAFSGDTSSLFFIQPALGTGWYFFSPSGIARLGLSAELSTRLVFSDTGSPYISKIMPLALTLGATGELSPFKKVRFYAGWYPVFYYRFAELPLYEYQTTPGITPGWNLFAGLYLNLASFNLGVRVLL